MQGAFIEHKKMLEGLGAEYFEIRQKKDLLQDFDGLVLPGGESTVIGKLMRDVESIMEGVEILAEVKEKIVGVRYENQIGIAFHPEVTKDDRIHKYFLELCESNRPDTARNMELSHSSSSGN